MSMMRSRPGDMRCTASQRGFTLVEAMVALVVLSIGMLGIAALHVESLKASGTALRRTQVVALVNDMADRIRANRQGRVAYLLALGAAPANNGCVVTNNCTPAQMAVDDLARWVTSVRAALPRRADNSPPWTVVQFVPGANVSNPDQYSIGVSWRDPGQPADYSYVVTIQVIPGAAI